MQDEDELVVAKYEAPAKAYTALGKGKRSRSESDEEEDSDDGSRTSTAVHVCIKAKGWDVTLGSALGTIDFRKAKLGARLVDHSSGDQIERKNSEPLEFNVTPSKDGKTASVELRIAVLSSQMEGALFAVEFAVSPLACSIEYQVTSEPIRVVSKKSQLEAGSTTKKRSRTTQAATREVVLDMIAKMEDAMTQSQEQMQALYAQNSKQAALIQSLLGRLENLGSGGGTFHSGNVEHEGARGSTPDRSSSQDESAQPQPLTIEQAFGALSEALQRDTGNRVTRLKQIGGQWDAHQWQLFNEAFCVLAGPQAAMRSSFHSSAGMTSPFVANDDLLADRGFLNGSLNGYGSVGSLFGL
jgi:hypothetical protein